MAIYTTPKELGKRIGKLSADYKFASVVALTWMAKDIQAVVKEELARKFTLRNRYTQNSIRIKPASKNEAIPTAEVFSGAWYMPLQDKGGIKRGEYWIPGERFYLRTGRPRSKPIPAAFKPPKILNKRFAIEGAGQNTKGHAKPFMAKMKSGKKVIAVRRRSSRLPIDVLYIEVKNPKIKAAHVFEEPAAEEYDRKFDTLFAKAFNRYVLKQT